jgi:L-amino acid N-acyltransferase YncA
MSINATIRDAACEDLQACQRIYAHWVLHGTGSFELEPPDLMEMQRRHEEVSGRGLPWLVATDAEGNVLGFAYANWFRPRLAYRFTVETSIYVDPACARQGLGHALLSDALVRCEKAGIRQAIAVIGDSKNTGSIGLHAALGFERTGVMEAVGWKFGRWLDVVIMQRALGPGAADAPN